MKIGVIYAMKSELLIFNNEIYKIKKISNSVHELSLTKNKKKIIFIQSGIGKTESSIACTILIKIYKVNFIINIGSAGKLNSSVKIFDIIIAKKVSYYDVNLKSFGYKEGQIPNYPKIFKTNLILRNVLKTILNYYSIKYQEGYIVSGDTFIDKKSKIKRILQKFPIAISVDMESSSIKHTCYKFRIPCLIIKIISDHSKKKASSLFKKNIKKTSIKIKKIITILIKFIISIKEIYFAL
ncbi:5'-methylthioadenosine/adenosylhomocysteine nucleosidase [Buchnera aphidicola]|uniref:5'-methylthioadenosine/adenosylhomocysteine nucleosidase n=1 Tax=Buchnera aphidicola TaxID=9 RepID=UPI0031B8228C